MSEITMYHWYRSREGSETMINYQDPNMFEIRKEHFEHIKELYRYWNQSDSDSINSINSYYIGRLFQCIQEISDNQEIKHKDKIKKIKQILNDKETNESLKNCNKLSLKFKILVLPMKVKSISMCLLFGKIVSYIRRFFPSLFIKIKEKEVHSAK